MEKIKISGSEKMYEICSIMPESRTVLKIVFPEKEDVPETWDGDILLHTAGGIQCSTITGYNTVYLQEGQTVYLSNDDSIYVPPAPPEPAPEPILPTLEEIKAAKKWEVSMVCEQVIYAGINVVLSDGKSYHFSLTEKDQINLFGKQAQLASGAEQMEYHADGHPCQYYSVEDMQNIVESAMWHVSYHTTYCNALNMWIEGGQTAEEVQEIFYGSDVPDEYRSEVLQAYLIQIAEMAGGGETRNESEETGG
ncbi:acyl carrier protein [Lachnospiraceae bacterium 38-10]